MTYKFADGYHLAGVNPQEAGPRLTAMADNGTLTPANVVEEARDPNHPLHAAFEWDNERAATQWRLNQARYVIRAVVVVESDGRAQPIKLFWNVTDAADEPDDSERRYVTTDEATRNPAYRAQVLEELFRQAYAWRERAQVFEELTHVVAAIETLPNPRVEMERKVTEAKEAKRRRRGKAAQEVETAA